MPIKTYVHEMYVKESVIFEKYCLIFKPGLLSSSGFFISLLFSSELQFIHSELALKDNASYNINSPLIYILIFNRIDSIFIQGS